MSRMSAISFWIYWQNSVQIPLFYVVFHRRCIKPNWDHLFDIISPYHSLRCSYTSQRIYLLNETAIYMSLFRIQKYTSGSLYEKRMRYERWQVDTKLFLFDRVIQSSWLFVYKGQGVMRCPFCDWLIAQYSQGRIWGEQNTMNTLPGVPKVAKSTRPVYKITILSI